MYTVHVFESASQLQAYLRGGGGMVRGDYYKVLRAGLLYFLIRTN